MKSVGVGVYVGVFLDKKSSFSSKYLAKLKDLLIFMLCKDFSDF
jgi:hypothetical protein